MTTTTWSGSRRRISRSTSMPCMPGSIRSRRTRSTSSRSRMARPSSPVPADQRRVPILADEHRQDVLEDLLVVDDQDVHTGATGEGEYRGSSTRKQAPSPGWLTTRRSAPVPAHDLIADRQAQAGAAAVELGRVEGLEDRLELVGRNAGAGVAHPHRDPFPFSVDPHRQPAAGRRFRQGAHGIHGVHDQVGEHLLQLAVAAHHLDLFLAEAPSRARYGACRAGRRGGRAHSVSSGARVTGLRLVLPLAGELQEVVDDARRPEGLALHLLQDFVVRIGSGAVSSSSIWA